jgi:molecular chaperone HtpG
VIDSADLPLNVSREILQESRDVRVIRDGSTKRVLGLLEELANATTRTEGQVHHLLDRIRPGAQGRHRRRRDQQGPPGQAAALARPTTTATSRMSRWPITWAALKEGQDKIYASADKTRPRTARTWKSSARRAWKCC